MTSRPNILIVGHGMVGNKVAEALVKRRITDVFDLTIVGEERWRAYDRVHLSSLFEGAAATDLDLADDALLSDPAVTVLTGESVVSMDRSAHVAVTSAGRSVSYAKAVLATGSYPFIPDVPGKDLPGCFVYRTIDDVDRIREWSNGRQHGVVIGGGLLGLEAANALRHCGVATEVVEFAPWLMPSQVDEVGGGLLGRRIESLGLAVHTSTTLASVVPGDDGAVMAVSLIPAGADAADAERLETEMVVFAAGIRPNDAIGRSMGLEIGPRGGIAIDGQCRTSDADIYAAGECAAYDGRLFGLVAPGYRMARVVAESISGADPAFDPSETPTKLKLLGVDVASFGDAHARVSGASTIVFTDQVAQVHKRIVVDSEGKVTGGILVGDISGFDELAAMAAGDLPTPAHPGALVGPAGDTAGAAVGGGVHALPPAATICSCENVSKGSICDLIASRVGSLGTASIDHIKSGTSAGTGCGGCVPQLAEILKVQLQSLGISVSSRLCEHFPHTRQDLVDLIRLEGITTFGELVRRHGEGLGCEICKPTVASILASIRGDHILDGEGAALQDTNDHVLANLQKDGTYSVVPRVPGGEITPEKLVVLGEVARDFALYVKITGGQRIDLLGARLHDLPAIWSRLVGAGFESGHAYGKAVRTVKSCVGSTWCRFGVQDSTTMAIDLELRYRGLRSPHKVKMAVSGCARECAEARSKDIGVIATERGWNLYVCGNGGTRPRHADLLAEDLDSAALIRIVDRFLAFYIRTADRLQRTSSWLEAMEGGLDHLKSVIIDDSLGICAHLEADIDRHVSVYRCEWADTLADPVRLVRFRTFVNTDAPDPDIVVVTERSQPRPAYEWERVELLAAR